MKITQMYVEQIIIGLLVLLAIALFVAPIIYPGPSELTCLLNRIEIEIADATLVVVAAYLLGMVYDRVADTILDDTDRHNRLRFALAKIAEKVNPETRKIPTIKTDPFDEAALRIEALGNGDAADYMEYLRSRMRLMRALCTLIPLYTVIASLYLVTDWKFVGVNSQSWICVGIIVLTIYGFALFFSAIGRKSYWKRPPKTNDTGGPVEDYLRAHLEFHDPGKDSQGAITWKLADCFKDPTWYAFAFMTATSIGVLAISGRLDDRWQIPITGVLLTLLTGWVWLRVSKTFMSFIRDFGTHPKKAKS